MALFNRSRLRDIFARPNPKAGDDLADVLEEGAAELTSKADVKSLRDDFERMLLNLEARLTERMTVMEDRFNERIIAMEDRFNERLVAMEDRFNDRMTAMEERLNERIAGSESRIEAKFYRAPLGLAVFFIALYGATVGLMIAFFG